MSISVDKLGVAILAGGKSSRMGTDKGLINLKGVPLVERIIRQISHIFPKIFIVTNKIEQYSKFGYPMVSDLLPDIGPLGGLYTALDYDTHDYTLLLSCDMPFVSQGMLLYLMGAVDTYDVVVPRLSKQNHPEPLRAIYSKRCFSIIEKYIEEGGRRVVGFYSGINVRYVERNEIEGVDPGARSFFNANEPADLIEAAHLTKYYPLMN